MDGDDSQLQEVPNSDLAATDSLSVPGYCPGMSEETAEELVDRLRSRGVRITAPRRAVLVALLEAGSHVNAETLHARVQARHPDISHSSIYRTMDLLTELGIVTHVHLGHGPAEFHLVEDAHSHLVCNGCGAVTDVDQSVSGPFVEAIADTFGFALDLRHFALTGWCRECRPPARDEGTTCEDGRP
jgi:Fur family ferric uptake transcriptional regulator